MKLAQPLCLSLAALLPGLLSAADIAPASPQKSGLKGGERTASTQPAADTGEAEKSRLRFKPPEGFTVSLWASEPMLGNPVSFSIDDSGAVYVAETWRYRSSTLDIRHYYFMIEEDMACRTTDDRIAEIKRNFPDEWPKLQIETEAIRRLADTTGAGKADTSTLYAAGMNTLLDGINSGVLAHEGQVWCTNMPNLWRFSGLKDGQAEKRESLSFGYGVRFSFTGHDLHGLQIGPDGRLYFSFGDRGANVRTKEGRTIAFPDEGGVFRCELDGSHLEPFYRGLRNPEELAFDNHGNLFTGDNDCDMGDRERATYLVEGGDSGWRVGWQHPPLGKDRDMWLVEKMWEPRKTGTPFYVLSPIMNIPDGPSGLVHNPGTGLPAKYDDAFLLCSFKGSPARSEICWWTVHENGAAFAPKQEPATFVGNVQATDVDFGPDSHVYFTDWGEGWEGTGHGRIMRLDNAEVETMQTVNMAEVKAMLQKGFPGLPAPELAARLGHRDQRVRLRAQWALAAKPEGPRLLLEAALTGQAPLARLHGIWGVAQHARMQGYRDPAEEAKLLTPLLPLLADPDSEVRAQTAHVLGDGRLAAAYEPLVKALQDPNSRVKFFAAMGLGKLARPECAEPVLALLRANADQDEFLRHAGVLALLGSTNEQALVAAAKDPSDSVRLAALLVRRRQLSPEVAPFLTDANPLLRAEAARAICDEGIAPAYPALAALLTPQEKDEHLVLRTLNAAFRSGTPAAAHSMAAYAADEIAAESFRLEALRELSLWPAPPARDFVAGVWRPLAARSAEPAIAALKSALPSLLAGSSAAVAESAIGAVQALGMKESGPDLFALMSRLELPAKVRAKALAALASFEDPRLAEAVRLGYTDRDPALRIDAIAILGRLDPEAAAAQLSGGFATAELPQQKLTLTSLGDLKGVGADKALSDLIVAAQAGKVPLAAQLELIEAASKRSSPVKQQLADWLQTVAAKDKLGRYSFALAGGDAARGEKVFKEGAIAQCFRCHKIQGVGGDVGPELTHIAKEKDRAYLLESVVDPNAKIAHGFESVMCTMTNGDIKAGIIKSETPELLTLQTPGAPIPPETLKKAEIKTREGTPSAMPPGLGEMITKAELRDVVEYLAHLK